MNYELYFNTGPRTPDRPDSRRATRRASRWSAPRRHEVPPLVLRRVVADHRALGNVHVAVDDGPTDAAMAPDVHVREDDARVHV